MNGFLGLSILIVSFLVFLIVMIIACSNSNLSYKLLFTIAIISLCISIVGITIMDVYTFKCCETVNLSNTCKICGYELNIEDKWKCCDTENYKNYCSVCGKEKNENTKIQDTENSKYIYCCETRYDPNINEFCSVCGKILEKNEKEK